MNLKKFEGILFTTDLDGTLLDDDKSISDENMAAIRYFMSEGGIFTFITGRIPMGARHIYNRLLPNGPVGCSNGGGIYDFRTEKLVWSTALSQSVLELVEHVDKTLPGIGIEVNTHEKIYFCKKNRSTEKHRTDEHFPDLTCHYNDVKEPIAKILFADSAENIEILSKTLLAHPRASEFDFVRSDEEYYEILPKNINKGHLVKKLAQLLGIDERKTVAAGDNDNDEAMLKMAAVSYAVSNASERAKAAADYITVSNREHAIARIIDELDKGKVVLG